MTRLASFRRAVGMLAVALLGATVMLVVGGCGSGSHTTAANAATTAAAGNSTARLRLGAGPVGPSVPRGFVGLATEYWDVERLTGSSATNPDVPFEHLLTNLSSTPILRIGGDSSDWVWWPIAGVRTPPWVHWSLSPAWTSVVHQLALDTGTKLLLGINLEADSSRVSNLEVSELAKNVGTAHIADFEVGNEPELYSAFPFYEVKGKAVKGRAPGYAWLHIAPDVANLTAKLPVTGVPLASPGFAQLNARPYVGDLLKAARRVHVVTVHTYPLKSSRCNGGHTLSEGALFTPASLGTLADGVASFVKTAARSGATVRTDEMNSVTCNGEPGFSNTFGPALWALNILADYAGTGDSGVNFDFEPISAQHLITARDTASGWQVQVQPTYYGLLAFAQAAPAGSRLIKLSGLPSGLLGWADRTPAGQRHVVITNVTGHTRRLSVSIPDVTGPATVALLAAAGGLGATGGVTLAGQTIAPSTGQLTGTPTTTTLDPSAGSYTVSVPAGAAAILTVK